MLELSNLVRLNGALADPENVVGVALVALPAHHGLSVGSRVCLSEDLVMYRWSAIYLSEGLLLLEELRVKLSKIMHMVVPTASLLRFLQLTTSLL